MSDTSINTVSLSSRRVTRSPLREETALPGHRSAAARPIAWLGASSAFGLLLPQAKPTSSQLYAPRGVWIDSERLIVCDSGNHRVLIWNSIPDSDGQPADIVLGQVDFESEGPAQGCGCYQRGMHLPTSVIMVEERLIVADAWHHRLLVWNTLPDDHNQAADYAVGQANLFSTQPNRGRSASANSLYWPYGLTWIDGRLFVADTGNRRVLAWNGIPTGDQPADLVLGQPDAFATEENRGAPASARSFRWPHAIAGDSRQLWVADAGNHRLLGWDHQPKDDCDACWVLGQPDMTSTSENPYTAQNEKSLRFPYGLALQNNRLIAADTANNRVLIWELPVQHAHYCGAVDVIGQRDFEGYGENHWHSVTHDSLCWPYGIGICGNQLAIADSGNNRVMLWDVASIEKGDRPALESCRELRAGTRVDDGRCQSQPGVSI